MRFVRLLAPLLERQTLESRTIRRDEHDVDEHGGVDVACSVNDSK